MLFYKGEKVKLLLILAIAHVQLDLTTAGFAPVISQELQD